MSSFLGPAILFFAFGVLAGALRLTFPFVTLLGIPLFVGPAGYLRA